jgi:hypothetical protein
MARRISIRLEVPPMTTTDSTTNTPTYRADADAPRRTTETNSGLKTTETKPGLKTTETKSAFKTTELIVFVLSVLGVLIAAAVTDNGDDGQGFGARSAWLYVTLLSVGYMISRGLAKAGSRERNDA